LRPGWKPGKAPSRSSRRPRRPAGRRLDWIPVESQVARGKIALPPPAHFLHARVEDTHRPVKAVTFELDDLEVERGPAGTVPVVRPELSRLTRTIEVQDYLTKKGGLLVNKQRHKVKPTDPNPAGYFHEPTVSPGRSTAGTGFSTYGIPRSTPRPETVVIIRFCRSGCRTTISRRFSPSKAAGRSTRA